MEAASWSSLAEERHRVILHDVGYLKNNRARPCELPPISTKSQPRWIRFHRGRLCLSLAMSEKSFGFFGSSHQSVPGLVQGIDFKFEELLVSEPVGLFLERFDFVVCALQRSC